MRYDFGIDVGSVSINCVVIDERRQIVHEAPYVRHFGLVYEETCALLTSIFARFGVDRNPFHFLYRRTRPVVE